MMSQGSQDIIGQPRSDDLLSINVWKILLMMKGKWYLYLLSLLISGATAYFYLKYKIPTYLTSTTVLIVETEAAPGLDFVEGFAVRPGSQNLDNQILILSSYSLIRRTVEELPFEIECYRNGLLSRASYYPLSPIRIEPGSEGLPYHVEFVFEYSHENIFRLQASSKNMPQLDSLIAFGQSISYRDKSFTIFPQPELEDVYKSGDRIYIQFYDKERLTDRYLSRLRIENATREGTIVRLSLQGTNKVQDMIFLNKLTEVYIQGNLEKKNQEAKRTIEFIEKQLNSVSDSLSLTETQLQEFRSRNRIMDVSAQAQQIIDQAVVLENERARLTLESNYYEYLEEYLSSEANEKVPVAPASMGIEDPLLANLMQELAALQAEYFSSAVGERNPLQSQLELRLTNTKNSIQETLKGITLANQMALNENNSQINNLNRQASNLPVKERQLLGFERKFNLNNVLYTFLLQSRAEAQIKQASNTADNELVDPSRSIGPVSPSRLKVLLIAIALAFALPTLILLLNKLIHNEITSEEDINLISKLPVIGYFPRSRLSYRTVVLNEPNSRISEAFRSLRTRLEFFTKEAKSPIILVTSSMMGEGKTFTAINLASAYSLAGKKTLLVGFDLRRPTLSRNFELNGQAGLTEYLIGRRSHNDIIQSTDFQNLHIIPSGPIPPNPGELTSSEETQALFNHLRKKYDYIVVDSPPVGIVSDIYPVAALADAVLLVVRHGHTKKNVLSATLSEIQGLGLHGLSLLLNDVNLRSGHYRYSYKYKYEYKTKTKLET